MKAISRTAVLAFALIISAFVFGQILTGAAQTSGASSGAIDCADIEAWSSTKTYATYGERVTHAGTAYRQNFWSQNKPPDQNSAPWGEPWVVLGTCSGDQPPTNHPPTGTLTAPTTIDSGAAATFTVSATDPDGDTLAYAWTRPTGFAGTPGNSASVTLTAPTVTTDQQATITVQVSDGRGGTLPLSKTFTVKAPAPGNRPPTASVEAPPSVNSGAIATFVVMANDPDGDPLTYVWTRPPGFGGTVGNNNTVSLTARQ